MKCTDNDKQNKGLLKFVLCGSVDDGKSTLTGRLLYNAGLLKADQEQELINESIARGAEETPDFSLLLDGLIAEREQGITIDVAYRYFATAKRSFIAADAPGHEQYTRNMAVAASFADAAVILIDASKGILLQTRRHARICSLMGIRDYIFVINKMDLVDYSADVFDSLCDRLCDFVPGRVICIPISALYGVNVTEVSPETHWYKGLSLLEVLENLERPEEEDAGFILPVQRISRAKDDAGRSYSARGCQGKMAEGSAGVGDEIVILPGNNASKIGAILSAGKDVETAQPGMSVAIYPEDEMDISRGCVIASAKGNTLQIGNMFKADLLWVDDEPLKEGRNYMIKLTTQTKTASVVNIRYKENIATGEHMAAGELEKNSLGCVEIAVTGDLVFDSFESCKSMGRFILIDKLTNNTAACGVIKQSVKKPGNLTRQELDITRDLRAAALGQSAFTIWFTGLSGAGKTALANALEKKLHFMGKHTMLLDGDNVRLGLNKNLGFNEYDRVENIRRVAEVARLMNDAGLIVLTSFISPFDADRKMAKEIIGSENFVEVYVSTPLAECERRDVKGLYMKARKGEIPDFTGISSPYEVPTEPDLMIDTTDLELNKAVDVVFEKIKEYL